jgi:hypothetical protein
MRMSAIDFSRKKIIPENPGVGVNILFSFSVIQ